MSASSWSPVDGKWTHDGVKWSVLPILDQVLWFTQWPISHTENPSWTNSDTISLYGPFNCLLFPLFNITVGEHIQTSFSSLRAEKWCHHQTERKIDPLSTQTPSDDGIQIVTFLKSKSTASLNHKPCPSLLNSDRWNTRSNRPHSSSQRVGHL